LNDSEAVPRGALKHGDEGKGASAKPVPSASPGAKSQDGGGGGFLETDLGRQVGAFVSHLEELRKRLIRAILVILAGMAVSLYYSEELVALIIRTAGDPETMKFSLLTPAEGILVYLKVGLVAGVFLSSPLWFAQLWGFISPGLYQKEKRLVVPVVAASAGAFLAGAAFAYYILPFTADYFRSFETPQIEAIWSLSSYVNMALHFLLAFGLVFELPLIIYAAASLGLVTPDALRKYRRHAAIGILVVAAFITPGPDVFSQIVVAGPLIVLYEVGILLSIIASRKRERDIARLGV